MKCNKCGFDNGEGIRFCGNCGAYLGERYDKSPAGPEIMEPERRPGAGRGLIIVAAVLIIVAGAAGMLFMNFRGKADTAPRQTAQLPEPTAALSEPTAEPVETPAPMAVGDIITMGEREQDGDYANGSEPIAWRVLAVENDSALIISQMVLDQMQYNSVREDVTWETSGIRRWLNGGFLKDCFSASERELILKTVNTNEPNPDYRTNSGNSTTDRVFLLSVDEAERYFSSDSDMAAQGTRLAYMNYIEMDTESSYSPWWLRTSGAGSQSAASVYLDSGIDTEGYWVDKTILGVRPAMWISMDR